MAADTPIVQDDAPPPVRFRMLRTDWVLVLLLPFWMWSALRVLGVGWWPWSVRIAVLAAMVAATVAPMRLLRRGLVWIPVLAAIALVQAGWMLRSPSAARRWIDVQDRSPAIAADGSLATVSNVRNVVWRTVDDHDVEWETREYDLATVSSVDFIVTTFGEWRGLAHTFLSFGFEDGRHLAASFEVRKERGEAYHPLAGLFRNYEIVCVLADERDAIGLRAFVQDDPTTVYPVRATPEAMRELLAGVLQRADELGRKPEFYNTVTNNCTTNLVAECETLAGDDLGFDWRILFPGYSDDLAFDLGFIDTDLPLEEARERFRVAREAPEGTNEVDWSRELRRRSGGENP